METKFMIGDTIQRCNPDGELIGLPFQARSIDFPFQDGRFVKVDTRETYIPKSEYDKLKEERDLLIDALQSISDSLEIVINATATGRNRNLLTDINILALTKLNNIKK